MGHIAIVGAGPAGAVLALLLARNGCRVTLLERHTDFAREFRGEVLMPSGLTVLEDVVGAETLGRIPQVAMRALEMYLDGERRARLLLEEDLFGRFAPRWISQPALLEMLVDEAARHPGFTLERDAHVSGLLEEGGRCVGAAAKIGGSEREIRADLVVGADGRGSVVRRRAHLPETRDPTPMDLVWCKVPMLPAFEGDPHMRAYLGSGHLLIAAPVYDGRMQVAWIIAKGTYGHVRSAGMPACLDEMALHVSPDLADHLRRHRDDGIDPFLLSTVSDHVHSWSAPGVLVLGDAAHTMSPVGAQGLNVAIRDAAVAANELVPLLGSDAPPDPAALDAATALVQSLREPEIRAVQRIQALPPRIVLRDAWWSRLALSVATRLAAGRAGSARAARAARSLAFGTTDVTLRV